jgi:antitoxin PrlF
MPAIIEESRITSKGQTTIPKAVRQALGVDSGDTIAFRIEGGRVRVERAPPSEREDPALDAFLGLLARDIQRRPRSLTALTPEFRARIAALTQGMTFDPDEPIEGEVEL